MNKCNHVWVYEEKLLLSNPPQRNRICSKCGKKDRITCGVLIPFEDTYKGIIKKFVKGSKDE